MKYMKTLEDIMTSGKTISEIENELEFLKMQREINDMVKDVQEFQKIVTQIK